MTAFTTGGPKNDAIEGKPDMSLLPLDLLAEVSKAYGYGTIKYKRNSHRGGFETHRMIAACLRHISDWNDRGQEYDKDAWEIGNVKVHHIAMAIFNLLCVLNSILYKPELVKNYVPKDFKPDVPIDDPELEERIYSLMKYWLSTEK